MKKANFINILKLFKKEVIQFAKNEVLKLEANFEEIKKGDLKALLKRISKQPPEKLIIEAERLLNLMPLEGYPRAMIREVIAANTMEGPIQQVWELQRQFQKLIANSKDGKPSLKDLEEILRKLPCIGLIQDEIVKAGGYKHIAKIKLAVEEYKEKTRDFIEKVQVKLNPDTPEYDLGAVEELIRNQADLEILQECLPEFGQKFL